MVAPVAPRIDQNSDSVSPGEIASTLVVKNSMRGAFGLGTRVEVATIATRVLVAPKIDVGEGPTVIVSESEVGATVGVELNPGVRLAVGVSVMVEVGRSVGTTCCTVAPQADRNSNINEVNKLIFLKKDPLAISGCKVLCIVINGFNITEGG
jgi:hypothetical protein